MIAFCPEHPKWDQNPKFTPLSEATSIPTPFICGFPPPRSLPQTQVFIVVSSKKVRSPIVGPEIPWDLKKWLHADAQPRRQGKINFSWEKLRLASPCHQMNGNQLIPVLSEALNALALVYTNVVSHQNKRKTLMHFSVFLIAGEKISILTHVHDFPRIRKNTLLPR